MEVVGWYTQKRELPPWCSPSSFQGTHLTFLPYTHTHTHTLQTYPHPTSTLARNHFPGSCSYLVKDYQNQKLIPQAFTNLSVCKSMLQVPSHKTWSKIFRIVNLQYCYVSILWWCVGGKQKPSGNNNLNLSWANTICLNSYTVVCHSHCLN